MNVNIRTNLDLPNGTTFKIPDDAIPRVGDYVLSNEKCNRRIRLEVHSVTWDQDGVEIELHIPKNLGISIRDWYKHYLGINI